MVEYGGRPTFYYYSAFLTNGQNWMGNTDCICDTPQQLTESVAKIKQACDIYHSLSDIRFACMQKHEQISEQVYEITYSNGIILRVDYARAEYQIVRSKQDIPTKTETVSVQL